MKLRTVMKKLKALSNFDIDHFFKNNSNYAGCIGRDYPMFFQKKQPNKKFWIVNLDTMTGPGTHWTLLYCVRKIKIFFDPFGMVPPQEIENFLKKTGNKCVYADIDIQDLDSDACGYYCCYVADQLEQNRSFVDILTKDFSSDTKNNELLMQQYAINEGILDLPDDLNDAEGRGILNSIINKLPFELHLPNYSACGPGTKTSEREARYQQTGDTRHIYINDLDKACYLHDKAYDQFKSVEERRASDIALRSEAERISADKSKPKMERIYAWTVGKLFKAKNKLGWGMKWPSLKNKKRMLRVMAFTK